MKKPFIIFLDIDGVLNCQTFYKDRHEGKVKGQICEDRMELLNELVEYLDATVVVSSTWRASGIEYLQEEFNKYGATFEIHDITPHGGKDTVRGNEIRMWLQENIKPETYGCFSHDFRDYVIIDDDSDMLLWQKANFFQTDNYSGLTPNICYKIKRFADGKSIYC